MYIYVNDGLELAILIGDHIEFDHEREMPGYWTVQELEKAHNAMHRMRNDWEHGH